MIITIIMTFIMSDKNILGFIAADIKGSGGWTQVIMIIRILMTLTIILMNLTIILMTLMIIFMTLMIILMTLMLMMITDFKISILEISVLCLSFKFVVAPHPVFMRELFCQISFNFKVQNQKHWKSKF